MNYDQRYFRQVNPHVIPPPPWVIQYYQALKNNNNWVTTIAHNCEGPHLPHLPPNPSPHSCSSTIKDRLCPCCIKNWSIVINTNTYLGTHEVYLVGLTEIKDAWGVYGYIYPNLTTPQWIPSPVTYIGCYFPLLNISGETMTIPTYPTLETQQTAQKWQAICNGHVGGWYGDCENNYSDALTDATDHDKNSHNGEKWATVVKRTCD
ncbi:hypothetical protein D3C76_141630 [compost metagenome]